MAQSFLGSRTPWVALCWVTHIFVASKHQHVLGPFLRALHACLYLPWLLLPLGLYSPPSVAAQGPPQAPDHVHAVWAPTGICSHIVRSSTRQPLQVSPILARGTTPPGCSGQKLWCCACRLSPPTADPQQVLPTVHPGASPLSPAPAPARPPSPLPGKQKHVAQKCLGPSAAGSLGQPPSESVYTDLQCRETEVYTCIQKESSSPSSNQGLLSQEKQRRFEDDSEFNLVYENL
ncbi:NFAT activation molecule 1 isoform X3 [Camelus ferus]|uniref:NFAT activation molecule 1 isoform X3 n=2 Tax=Camelus TaxID=9836 RepID=A0A8B8U1C5_CAMFR|nr:NFAT activation molecule 1 isoform X3 [Camelus ferus]XP_045376555.1 NFAT activation molecule 1 isoform X3 [Camelus bactrianus]